MMFNMFIKIGLQQGRHLSHKFNYKACELECVQHCKYLGVYFSASVTYSYMLKMNYKTAKLVGFFMNTWVKFTKFSM
jgi:hypothetical protein